MRNPMCLNSMHLQASLPDGKRTTYVFDQTGKGYVNSITSPSGYRTTFVYRDGDSGTHAFPRTIVTDPRGHVTTFTVYETLVRGVVNPLAQRTTYSWFHYRLAGCKTLGWPAQRTRTPR